VGLGIAHRLLVQDTVNDICPNLTRGHEEYLQQDIILWIATSLKTRGNPSTATPRLRSRLPASGATRIAWKNRQRDIGGIRASAASLLPARLAFLPAMQLSSTLSVPGFLTGMAGIDT
jgi:hypothetical protein